MSNQLQITGAAKVRGLEGVLTGTSGIVGALGINVANGIPKLDSNGKILVSQLPSSVMEYKGTWNAATNTPTLANGTGDVGDVYLCNVAGTTNFGAGPITFAVGDQVIYSGSIWQKASGATGTVTSVAMTVPSGLTVTGSPITTSGTLAVSLSSGYTIPTTSFLAGLVPYSGATGSVNLGEYGLSTGYLGLDLTPTGTPTSVGTLSWDSFYKTPQVITGTGSTTLQIGQEEVILVHNNTGSTLTDGQVVYVTGSTGELPSVSLADASSETTSAATLGVVTETIANGADGFITVSGIVHGLNTLAYTEGDLLWLSETAGQFTNVKPISPAHLVLIGYVIKRAGGNGSILVKIQNTQELKESSDVLFTSLANNDILQYKSATGLWVNSPGTTTSIAEGTNLYYTDSRARAALSATTPLSYNSTTGAFSIQQASGSQSGFLSSSDWNTFNGKQAALSGNGFVKIAGTTISYDNTSYLPITGGVLYGNLLSSYDYITSGCISLSETGTLTSWANSTNFTGTTNGLKFKFGGGLTGELLYDVWGLIFKNAFGYTAAFQHITGANLTYTLPSTNGTLALTSDIPSLANYVTLNGAQTISGKKTFTTTDRTTFTNSDFAQATFTYSGGQSLNIGADSTDSNIFSSGGLKFYTNYPTSTTPAKLTISTSGAATFSSSVTATQLNAANSTTTGSSTLMSISKASGYGTINFNLSYDSTYFANGKNLTLLNEAGYAAAIFAWNNAGTQSNFLVPNGNVGIGTSSPNSALNIVGNAATNGLTIKSAGNGGTYPFRVTWSGGSDGSMLCVNDNGYVGIGTSSPQVLLHLYDASLPRLQFSNSTTGTASTDGFQIYQSGLTAIVTNKEAGDVVFGTSDTERMRIRANGYKTFNGPGGQDQMFSGYARAANGDYLDINTEAGGGNYQGFLIVANSYAYNAGYRTQGTHSILGRSGISVTTIAQVNGGTGSSTYSISSPSDGVIRVTNTGLYGDLIVSWRGFI